MTGSTSVFDTSALAAHAAWRQREQAINTLLVSAGWTGGEPLTPAVRRMRQSQRDHLGRLLEQQADRLTGRSPRNDRAMTRTSSSTPRTPSPTRRTSLPGEPLYGTPLPRLPKGVQFHG